MLLKKENGWKQYNTDQKKWAFEFAESYKAFLDRSKTEREFVRNSIILAEENGFVNDIKTLEPIDERWKSFGWNVVVIDGHNFKNILEALENFHNEKNKPTVIIANTIKGKGVDFMEYDHNWHGKAPSLEQLEDAVANLK